MLGGKGLDVSGYRRPGGWYALGAIENIGAGTLHQLITSGNIECDRNFEHLTNHARVHSALYRLRLLRATPLSVLRKMDEGPPTPEQYRASAAEIRQMALRATSRDIYDEIIGLAERYDRLAARAEASQCSPLATLQRAWKRASHGEREQFLAEIVNELEQEGRPTVVKELQRWRDVEQRLVQPNCTSPSRRTPSRRGA
jgi:hypothetical protein